jgi:hypothetical protein
VDYPFRGYSATKRNEVLMAQHRSALKIWYVKEVRQKDHILYDLIYIKWLE